MDICVFQHQKLYIIEYSFLYESYDPIYFYFYGFLIGSVSRVEYEWVSNCKTTKFVLLRKYSIYSQVVVGGGYKTIDVEWD